MRVGAPTWTDAVKIAAAGGERHATSENNCVKTNKDRHILPAVHIFGTWILVSADMRFVRIIGQVL